MDWQPALPHRYRDMSGTELDEAIEARRAALGDDLLILGHHYQQEAVIRHADLTGDSLKLSRLAARETARRGARWVVFCGVNFMAETADVLTDERVAVILPNLGAACPMAAMAEEDDVREAWAAIHEALGGPAARVVPVAYVNSCAAVKAFVGERGGACCTSSNAGNVMAWALAGGDAPGDDRIPRVLFLPDEHLGRNTAAGLGLCPENGWGAGAAPPVVVWDPKQPPSERALRAARLVLWKGHCYVHTRFRPENVLRLRGEDASPRGTRVIVHPECRKEVVDLADESGSTERIIRAIEASPPGSAWAVGTEVHLVQRLARRHGPRGVTVRMLGEKRCMCAQMLRTDPPHLLWVLDNLAAGRVVNRIVVERRHRRPARLAVQRMLRLVC